MKRKQLPKKIYSYSLIIILSLLFILSISNEALALTCKEKYPNDGYCTGIQLSKSSCGTSYVEDTEAGLCTEGAAYTCCHQYGMPANLTLQVPLFGYTKAKDFPEYVGKIFEYAMYAIVPLTIIMIIVGGVMWVLAHNDVQKIKKAKERITYAITGLILALLSYTILGYLGLTTLPSLQIQTFPEVKGDFVLTPEGIIDLAPLDNVLAAQSSRCISSTNPTVLFTFYYKPPWSPPDYGSFGSTDLGFRCNVGMNCDCPNGKTDEACPKLPNYHPCAASNSLTTGNYCVKTKFDGAPNGYDGDTSKPITIAADPTCFLPGCQFTIEGDVPGRTYEVQDGGSWIKSMHMDIFAASKTRSSDLRKLKIQDGNKVIKITDLAKCFGSRPTETASGGNLTHAEAVRRLKEDGIFVTSSGVVLDDCGTNKKCTTLKDIPEIVITELKHLKKDAPAGCTFNVIGGTETGHASHGPGKPYVDITEAMCLKSQLQNFATYKISQICVTIAKAFLSFNCGGYYESTPHFHLGFK